MAQLENGGVEVRCPDGSLAKVNPPPTPEADNPSAALEVIDVCAAGGAVVLRTEDGKVLALNAVRGASQYLTVLQPGVYDSGEKPKCAFQVYEDGGVDWPAQVDD